jgi:4-aminobutyrate aminotransferase-like enzyme
MLDVLEEENLPQHAFEVGTYLRRQFEDMKCRWIGDVRGSGLFMGIELIRPDTQQNEDDLDGKVQIAVPEPATAETSFICTILKDKHQILTSIDGLYDNVLVIKPPMVFSKDDADLFVNSFEMAIQELETLDGETLKDVGRTST